MCAPSFDIEKQLAFLGELTSNEETGVTNEEKGM
jgi:hypothetical protein